MFFNIGGAEILVIAVVALIAIGPEQLPTVMRKVGGFVAQARSVTTSLRDEFMSGMDEITDLADPTSWTGSGTDDDPVVPRGFAQRQADDADSPSGDDTSSSGSTSTPSGRQRHGGQLGRLDVPPPFSPSPGASTATSPTTGPDRTASSTNGASATADTSPSADPPASADGTPDADADTEAHAAAATDGDAAGADDTAAPDPAADAGIDGDAAGADGEERTG
ncbi:MAG: Sec-independent protein translocase protein TatB [Actinomycetota bacterium]